MSRTTSSDSRAPSAAAYCVGCPRYFGERSSVTAVRSSTLSSAVTRSCRRSRKPSAASTALHTSAELGIREQAGFEVVVEQPFVDAGPACQDVDRGVERPDPQLAVSGDVALLHNRRSVHRAHEA